MGVLAAHAEAKRPAKELRVLVAAMAPALLAQPGVGRSPPPRC